MQTDAYWEGYNACYDGQKTGTNPYSEADDAWGEWQDGYEAALKEMAQEFSNGQVDLEIDAATYN